MYDRDERLLVLRSLSPVHVGGREPAPASVGADPFGLVRPPGDTFAYAVDDDLLASGLRERGGLELVGAWADFLASWGRGSGGRRGGPPGRHPAGNRDQGPLQTFLAERQLLRQDFVRKVAAARVPSAQAFQPFIRNGLGRAYIPGSAIKGALRTAVLWRLVESGAVKLDLEKHLAQRMAWWKEQAGRGMGSGCSMFASLTCTKVLAKS